MVHGAHKVSRECRGHCRSILARLVYMEDPARRVPKTDRGWGDFPDTRCNFQTLTVDTNAWAVRT